jgi:hypothetical protein
MHNLGKIPDFIGKSINMRSASQDRRLPRSELSNSHIHIHRVLLLHPIRTVFRRFAKRKATLASSCQFVRITPTPTGKDCIKFYIKGFYKNSRTYSYYGKNHAKITDTLHKDLYIYIYIFHCLAMIDYIIETGCFVGETKTKVNKILTFKSWQSSMINWKLPA